MKTTYKLISVISIIFGMTSCSDFLEEQVPQATLTQDEVKNPEYVDNVLISAYAGLVTIEDMNASFSLWNYDTRSDDAYVGGSDFSDGEPFHRLEKSTGVMTTDWPFSSIWNKFYNYLSRVSLSLDILASADQESPIIQERTAEMKFLRAYGHFQLKRLFKKIPFVNKPNMQEGDYNALSNTEYTNDEGWQQIINDLQDAYAVLPVQQAEKGRPTKAAAAAFLAKIYLYKAYRQDDANTNQVTSINQDDLKKVVEYTAPAIYEAGGYGLEKDFHNNFRPETQYENGMESIWAIQYSINDGSTYGNLNWSYGLIVPNIPDVTDGGCDFYKPTQNLVNSFKTNADGLPMANYNDANYDMTVDNADPRLFLTVGITGLPYMFNKKYIMDRTPAWSRSGGIYGYYVTLKHNVDPDLIGSYLIHGSYWASPMNRIVFRYADVLLMRAEALAQLGQGDQAIPLVNQLRDRAAKSTQMIADYESRYGVHPYCKPYTGSYSKDDAIKIVKTERRLEMALESERFFDLVRWGDAPAVITSYVTKEKERVSYLGEAQFTQNRDEYLPIPHEQISSSNGHYVQNINWGK